MTEAPTLAGEVDFAELGPATRLAIKTGLAACDREIRLLEERLTFPSARGTRRRQLERDLAEWRAARTELLTHPYPRPYKPGQSSTSSAGGEETPRR